MATRARSGFRQCLRQYDRMLFTTTQTLAPVRCSLRSMATLVSWSDVERREKHRIAGVNVSSKRDFHFATSEYALSFLDLPKPDTQAIRSNALEYLKTFDPDLWYNDPIVSLVNGEKLVGTIEAPTRDALGKVNGRQLLANSDQVAILKDHIRTFVSDQKDLRGKIRQVERLFFQTTDDSAGAWMQPTPPSPSAGSRRSFVGYLIGNQCLDFQKQDGVTEIEEAIIANTVERRLNDMLLEAELADRLTINRSPIFVAGVSNFGNFLDLSRKVLRSLELGIPVVILGRAAHTSQHLYRWTQLLVDLCLDAGIHPGMVTFLSCSLDDIKDMTSSCQDRTGNLYVTGSRLLAAEIKEAYPNTVASTGGPNTMICTDWKANDNSIKDAIANSSAIESAGQCTALRLCVVPTSMADSDCQSVFDSLKQIDSAESALREGSFAGVFQHAATSKPPVVSDALSTLAGTNNYIQHVSGLAFLKVRSDDLPEPAVDEFWRQVVVDFTKMDLIATDTETGKRQIDDVHLQRLTAWINQHQPISLAVNGPRSEAIMVGLKIWERTSLVVNTIGSTDDIDMPPAMTCQARPQHGEIFGEFPPRSEMSRFTTFPVLIPSSNPSYDASYTTSFLQSKGAVLSDYIIKSTKTVLAAIQDDVVRGYCVVLIEYLQNVARLNPKQGFGPSRTVLWGIQRPPLHQKTIIRCDGPQCSLDHVAPILILFHATTARDQCVLSIDPDNEGLIAFCRSNKLQHVVEGRDAAMQSANRPDVFHLVSVSDQDVARKKRWPMAGNFASLYLPMGHVKSTKANDEEFELHAQLSPKWLNTLF